MKKCTYKIIAAGICAVLAVTASVSVYAASEKNGSLSTAEATVTAEETNSLPGDASGISKDETVYVIAGADGKTKKIIVSDWLKNSIGSSVINDESELSDAENVKGDETYVPGSDNTLVWDAQGKDICYTGSIEKELPVNMTVSYFLDGNEISPSELTGKSGRLTIRYEYENNLYENVEINGKTEKIYVPFAAATALLLDSDVFTDAEVSNGKILNDGSHTIVTGIAFPGLQSSLGIDSEKLEIPDYVEITANVKNFELSNTVTIVTNSMFNSIDTDEIKADNDLEGSINELSDGMNQLLDGSSQLHEGLCTLLDRSGELVSGINTLADGADQLKNGSTALESGAEQLYDGTAQLKAGLDSLSENSSALDAGATEVFESLLSMADSNLANAGLDVPKLTIDNYAQVLDGVLANLSEDTVYNAALEKITASVNDRKSEIEQAVTAAVNEEVTAKILASMDMTAEKYNNGVQTGEISAEQQAQIKAAVDAQMKTDEVKAVIKEKTEEQTAALIEQNMNSDDVKKQIAEGEKQAASGRESINALRVQLDSYNKFYAGLTAYTDGVDAAKSGADSLIDGAAKLRDGSQSLNGGISEMYDGISTMQKSSPELISGITELRDGSLELSDGLDEFNEKGVQRLINAVDGDLAGLVDRINALKNASEHYRSFSGISDDMDGEVKFIYRTDEISME